MVQSLVAVSRIALLHDKQKGTGIAGMRRETEIRNPLFVPLRESLLGWGWRKAILGLVSTRLNAEPTSILLPVMPLSNIEAGF